MKEKLIDNACLAETELTELKGRLLQLANTLPPTNLGTFDYAYDNPLLGQRTSMTSSLGATNYSYDSNYQLTGATYPSAAPFNGEVHAWTYDNIGNRLTNTVNASTANYAYFKNGSNPLNGQRLQSDGTKTYTYDANGNVTSDGTYTYAWDYENRLTGITGGGLTASFSYDYEGRRKGKTINGVTSTYLYKGSNLIREVSVTATDYVFGPGTDEVLAASTSGGISYYNSDSLGSVIAINDSVQAIQNSYDFDAWGVLRNQTGLTPNSFLYTARESAEVETYFYRARFYNPLIGRFISEDPTGWNAGVNFYTYVLNRPISLTDPTGQVATGFVTGDIVCRKEPGDAYWTDVIMFVNNDTICVWGKPTAGGVSNPAGCGRPRCDVKYQGPEDPYASYTITKKAKITGPITPTQQKKCLDTFNKSAPPGTPGGPAGGPCYGVNRCPSICADLIQSLIKCSVECGTDLKDLCD